MGLRLFANDNDSLYPFTSFSRTNSGGAENLWQLFQMAQSDISSPRVLICPSDSARRPASDFLVQTNSEFSSGSLAHPSRRNMALSYFYALEADEGTPTKLLMGDRNLTRDSTASDQAPGNVILTGAQRLGATANETKDLRWSTEIHDRGGNITFTDGSAAQLTNCMLREALQKSGDPTNRIWLPN